MQADEAALPFPDRVFPTVVMVWLSTGEFVATTNAITDPALRELVTVGGIDQLTHADDTLINFTCWPEELTQTYRRLLTRTRDQPAG